ncbi:Armadillo-type fold [Trinorchestia longiramus]|nr:Armadillo-type fold [Trinorchestia longiramus]
MATILRSPDTLKSWHLVEAALFVMQSVAKNLVPEDENTVVTEVVESVLNQAAPSLDGSSGGVHVQVALTSLQLLAELNEWFKYHPAVLPNVLTFCTQRLQCPALATVAARVGRVLGHLFKGGSCAGSPLQGWVVCWVTSARALDAICSCCHAHMEPHFEGLMHIVCSLDSMMVTNSAVVGLLKGVTNVLNQFPNSAIRTHMDKLCGLQVEHLNRLLQKTARTAERGTTDDPIIWLDRLSAVFRHVNPSLAPGEDHPCTGVVMKVWPTISGIMEQYSQDVRVMEHCCRCLRFAVRCVHKDSAPMLPPLVSTIVKLYGDCGHSCFVYLGSILVDEYGTEEGCVSGLIKMLEAFTPKTFELLIQPNGFKNHPDTVDDWFRLCTRFLQRCPVPFLQCPVIGTIIECGLQACLLDHKDANAAVLKFFQDLLLCALKDSEASNFPTRLQLVGAALTPHFSKLIENLITGAVFVLPPYMHHEVAETLLQLNRFNRAQFCAVLEEKLRNIPRTNSSGNVVVSEEQVQELHSTITTAPRPKDIAKTLIDFSRYYT